MPTPDDVPENVDLNWIARHLVGFREEMRGLKIEVRDLKSDLRHIREDLDVVAMRVIRIDTNLTALRDDVRTLFEMHRELRERVENIERGPPAPQNPTGP
jgi:predicted  nucleic acid-binding Zn-ribbon protein